MFAWLLVHFVPEYFVILKNESSAFMTTDAMSVPQDISVTEIVIRGELQTEVWLDLLSDNG